MASIFEPLQNAPSGLAAMPSVPWGSHVGHLFETAEDLKKALVPYFKAGLENNERCLWVTNAPLDARAAREALRKVLPDMERREQSGQLEILDGSSFYDPDQPLPSEELVAGLMQRAEDAVAAGFKGLRTNGNCAWVGTREWSEFQQYESLVQRSVFGRRMICMCSYRPEALMAQQLADVIHNHDTVLRSGGKQLIRSSSMDSLSDAQTVAPWSTRTQSTMAAWLTCDQGILDSLPIGLYCCDSNGLIVRANRRANQLWGHVVSLLDPAHRFGGAARVESLNGSPQDRSERPIARAVTYGESFEDVETIVHNLDGRWWACRSQIEPLRDDAGHIVGAVECFEDITPEYQTRLALERQQRTFDLAMIASQMGTWRYTLADNICVYDDNAQRLYGLTDARFLHDEAGVKDKFHADDLELMWARVARALDPNGDGRYDVEYRVKQIDGSWRWLSAWGTVEFEGHGADRRPVAISGASRDLSELKKAEDLQRLLVNELNHRVKNTLATVQAIVAFTLHRAGDLRSAKVAISERIVSLARVHELLTLRNWSGADVAAVVRRALEPFAAGQLSLSGPSIDVAPNHALAISLGLHELATNAAKYGALSVTTGRVEVSWRIDAGLLKLSWRESGGPPVSPPKRRGFGSQLLEFSLARDVGGETKLEYAVEGVRCDMVVVI